MNRFELRSGKAELIRHQMNLRAGMQSNPYHGLHIREFCDYADALAESTAEYIMKQLPALIRKELDKKEVEIKVEEKAYQTAKKKVNEFAEMLRKMWR